MMWTGIQDVQEMQVLHLTTIGRRTGLPREIEIWFVVYRDCFYLFAETGEAAAWIKDIRSNPEVTVHIGEQQFGAVARVLDRDTDRELWDQAAALAKRKYGWGDGLPVEISPFPLRTTDTDPLSSQPSAAEPTVRGQHEAICDLPHGRERRWAYAHKPVAA